MGWIADFWGLVRRVDRAFEVQAKHAEALEKLTERLNEQDRRIAALEQSGPMLAAVAEAAATRGAAQMLSDVSRRVGVLEGRTPIRPANPAGPPDAAPRPKRAGKTIKN